MSSPPQRQAQRGPLHGLYLAERAGRARQPARGWRVLARGDNNGKDGQGMATRSDRKEKDTSLIESFSLSARA